MTDDELERALFALPLEEPAPDLRARILASTVGRPRLTVRQWEIWLVGTLAALAVWLGALVATSMPDVGGAITLAINTGIDRASDTVPSDALLWTALGTMFAVCVLALMSLPTPWRRASARHFDVGPGM